MPAHVREELLTKGLIHTDSGLVQITATGMAELIRITEPVPSA